MSVYSVKCNIDQFWVEKYHKTGTKLCFSHGAQDSGAKGVNFNVAGVSSLMAENVFLNWTDVYSIAGGDQQFVGGTTIAATTDLKEIKFKESIELKESFLLKPPVSDKTLPEGSFAFQNKVIASAYVYKKISDGGQDISFPFYISQNGPNAPGRSVLTPKPILRLFFADNVETQTMIDNYQGTPIDIDLTGKTSAVVSYDKNGVWKQVS